MSACFCANYEEYSYDHLDRLVKVLYNGDVEKYYIVYNADGGIYSITEIGTTHIYEYDSLDRLIRAWQKDSSGNIDLYVENSYDSYGRSTGSTYVVNGQTLSYTVGYNDVPNTVARFYYPTFGGDTKINFYTYDELQRLTKKDLAIDLMSKASESYEYYTYTPSSSTTRTTSLISKLTLNANGVETVYDYYYDALGNLFYIQKDGEKVTRYDYDELNQLVREDDVEAGYTYLYFYDLAGNVTEKRQYALATAPSYHILSMPDYYPYTVVETYSYSDSSWGDLLTNYNGTEITYDGLGNPLNWKNASSLTWEDRKLTAHDSLDNVTKSRYFYNSEGIRTTKTVITVGDTSDVYEYYDYILDGTKILYQYYRNSSTQEKSHLYFLYDENGSVSGFNDGTNTYFYQKNIQGDIIRIVDVSGNVVTEYTYDAWGKVLSVTGSLADTIGQRNPFRYRGYYYDSETGWYYLNSRYYDPDIGRFINADSILGANGGIVGYNLFAYCNNNPVILADSTGKQATLSAPNVCDEHIMDLIENANLDATTDHFNYSKTDGKYTVYTFSSNVEKKYHYFLWIEYDPYYEYSIAHYYFEKIDKVKYKAKYDRYSKYLPIINWGQGAMFNFSNMGPVEYIGYWTVPLFGAQFIAGTFGYSILESLSDKISSYNTEAEYSLHHVLVITYRDEIEYDRTVLYP